MLRKALSTFIHTRKYSIREYILAYIFVTFTLFGGFSSYSSYRANKYLTDVYTKSIAESKLENTFLRLSKFARENSVFISVVQDSAQLNNFLQALTTESIALRHNQKFFIPKGHSSFNQGSLSNAVLNASCDGRSHEFSHLGLFIEASLHPEFNNICAIFIADSKISYTNYFIFHIRDNMIFIFFVLLSTFFKSF